MPSKRLRAEIQSIFCHKLWLCDIGTLASKSIEYNNKLIRRVSLYPQTTQTDGSSPESRSITTVRPTYKRKRLETAIDKNSPNERPNYSVDGASSSRRRRHKVMSFRQMNSQFGLIGDSVATESADEWVSLLVYHLNVTRHRRGARESVTAVRALSTRRLLLLLSRRQKRQHPSLLNHLQGL